MMDVLVHRERHLRIRAIDRTRRGVDQVVDPVVPGTLEYVGEPQQVAVDVGERVLDRVPNSRLGREMYHAVEAFAREELGHSRAVGEIELLELECGLLLQDFEPRELQPHVVIIVEVIEPDDFLAPLQQLAGGVEADESGGAGDEDLHGSGDRG